MREVWELRRSRPPALPSIGYRGFAVAPITLRAPARRVVITSGINGRAMRLLLPPSADGPPPSMREVWGLRAFSKPRIQPRVQGRNPARFKGGYGVPRGFKGEKSKSPPNPLGLAERVPRPQAVEGVSGGRMSQENPLPNFICFICFICIICPTHIRHMMFFFLFF